MKKINWLALALVLALVLSGCGARLPALEDCVWVMSTLQSMEQEGQVIAYGEGGSSTLKTARELRLTCRATDGTLFLEDHTCGKQYEGTYRIYQKKGPVPHIPGDPGGNYWICHRCHDRVCRRNSESHLGRSSGGVRWHLFPGTIKKGRHARGCPLCWISP